MADKQLSKTEVEEMWERKDAVQDMFKFGSEFWRKSPAKQYWGETWERFKTKEKLEKSEMLLEGLQKSTKEKIQNKKDVLETSRELKKRIPLTEQEKQEIERAEKRLEWDIFHAEQQLESAGEAEEKRKEEMENLEKREKWKEDRWNADNSSKTQETEITNSFYENPSTKPFEREGIKERIARTKAEEEAHWETFEPPHVRYLPTSQKPIFDRPFLPNHKKMKRFI